MFCQKLDISLSNFQYSPEKYFWNNTAGHTAGLDYT